jgi:hypothetical protein
MAIFRKEFIIGFFFVGAAVGAKAEESAIKLEPLHIQANWEGGQIEKFDNRGNQTAAQIKNKQLISHSSVWLVQQAQLADNVKVSLGVGGIYFFIPASPNNNYSFGQRSAFGLSDLHAEFDFWKREESDHGLSLRIGVIPYKYNEDAKNLGEYMFRTYTYPTIIYTGGLVALNSAGVQLDGVDLNTKLAGLKNDLMVTVKTDQAPSGALSLTDILSYSIKNVFTIGGGYQFDNFYDATGLARGNFNPSGVSNYYVLSDGRVINNGGKLEGPDSALVTESGHYTFVGQKAMGRASLDLGNLISDIAPNSFFKDKQFRLYGEVIAMGIKNYPGNYQKLKDRIAYMYGLNIPTGNLLDLLSVEAEFCRNPLPDNSYEALQELAPVPKIDAGINGNSDNLKWTLYAQKKIMNGFSISAQAARDHMRLVDFFGHYYDQTIMQHPDNWYWAVQFGYSI